MWDIAETTTLSRRDRGSVERSQITQSRFFLFYQMRWRLAALTTNAASANRVRQQLLLRNKLTSKILGSGKIVFHDYTLLWDVYGKRENSFHQTDTHFIKLLGWICWWLIGNVWKKLCSLKEVQWFANKNCDYNYAQCKWRMFCIAVAT